MQVFVSAAAIALLALAGGFGTRAAIVIGLILALSSTAFVLQMLAEKRQLTTSHGRAAFSILLFQDLAAIPLIAILPLIGDAGGAGFEPVRAVIMIGTIVALIVGGRYLLRPVLQIAAASRTPEIFTATALLVVLGAALLIYHAGMSMVLGAFLAGMLLADSEYRHQLEADIAPFKGLLLGLFFIAVGMTVNLGLLAAEPARIGLIVLTLMLAKAIVLVPLARFFGMCNRRAAFSLAAIMSQGGEFAFVLFGIASREGLLPVSVTDELILAVAVSMLATPFIYMLSEALGSRAGSRQEPEYDRIEDEHNEILIAGFGRVGQVVGRILRTVGKPFTALEIDSSQVDVVRRYGNKVHYGDASRLDVLRAAGAEHARIFVLAIDDIEASVRTAETVLRNFPQLTIVARARNRRHAHWLMDLGIQHVFRETLLSSTAMSERILQSIGFEAPAAREVVESFRERDAKLLIEQHAIHQSEEKLIQSARDTATELESLFRDTMRNSKND